MLFEASLPDNKFNNVVLPLPEGPKIAVKFAGLNFPFKLFKITFSYLTLIFLPVFSSFPGTSIVAVIVKFFQASSILLSI